MDWTNVFCAPRKASSTGSTVMTLPAITAAQFVWCWPWNVVRPSCSVYTVSWLTAISGQVRSFQVVRNVSTATVLSAGRDSGSTIVNSTRSREQPSIHAASSSSRGRDRKNWRSRNTANGVTSDGTMSAPRLSIRPSFFITRNVGIMVSWNGIAIVATISASSAREPANRIRANAYPPSAPNSRFDTTVTAETISEFPNQRRKSAFSKTYRYPAKSTRDGHKAGGNRLISALLITELSSSHTSGAANTSASGTSSRCHGLNGSRGRRGTGSTRVAGTSS